METAIETEIKTLAEKAGNATTSHEAMQFAQAAMSLAHVEVMLAASKKHNE